MHIVPGMDIIYEVDAIVEAKVECSLYEIFTALSFLSVPLAFTYLGRKKKDPPRSLLRIFHMVSLFIAISGIVHLLNPFLANNNLIPIFQHILKMMVPICAILTSAAIYLLVPCIINMPSACQLQRLNTELKQLNMELQEHRDNLNREVAARTHELLQEQAKWKSIAEHAPQILWLKNKEGQMEFYNKRWYEYTGTDPSVVVGPCSRAVHPSDLEIMHQRWAEGGFSTQVSDYKIRIKAADNSYRWHLTRCVPIHDIDTGEVIQYVGISTDIHDTEIMSEISTADATRKSRFLAMISHEMRTPLTGIIGMATLLGDTALQAPQTDLLNNVKLSADKLLYLVNNILDLFKLHNDKLNLEITTFELHDCIQSALDTVSDEAGLKNITLHDDTEYDKLPTLIQADSTRLKQVLMNIYANAVKFTEEGGHIYTLASVEDEDNKKRIKISVQDTGIGIEQDNIFKVFETFSQVDSSSTRRFGGTGVGLAISKGLVELMRGNIWCESEPGKGATFHFTFEIEDVTNDTVRSDSRIPMASKPLLYASSCDDIMNSDGVIISDISSSDEESSHVAIVESPCITDDEEGSVCIIKPKVLIVDDTEMNQKVLKRYLTTLGYTDVDVVSDGAKAVAAVSNNRNYDVIFMDMEMPVMDGVTAAAQIRSLPLDKQPHIIAVTANAFQEDVQKCLDAGMCSHMAKPIKREDIKKKMDKAIQVLAGNETCTCHKANQLLHQHAKTPTNQLQHQQHENKTSTNQQSQQHDNTKLQMNQLSQQQTNTKSPTNQQPQIVQFQQEPQNQTIKPQPLQTQLRQTQQLHKPPSPPLQDPTLQQLFPQPPLELLHLLPLSPPPIQQPQINHNQLSHRHPTQQQNTHHQAN